MSCNPEAEAPVPGPTAAHQATHPREVSLFYPTPALRLAPEQRELELPEIETFAIEFLTEELLNEMNARWPGGFVPEGSSVRAAYVVGNTAVIDLDAPLLTEGWSTGSQTELLAVQAMVHTVVANFDDVESVQILANGGEVPTFAGHVDLSKPLRPDGALVAGR